jgi:arylsulfatase A-like enzyme
VVFTSDHGEMLERSTRGHLTPLLYEPITHVPLIISNPGQTKREDVLTPTSCLDVLPTLAHLVGQPIPGWGEGELLPTLGGAAHAGRSIFTVEAKSNARQAPLTKATVSMIKDEYKLIHYRGYDQGYDNLYELYDLKNDPEELNDLYGSNPAIAAALQSELAAKLEEVNRPYQRA